MRNNCHEKQTVTFSLLFTHAQEKIAQEYQNSSKIFYQNVNHYIISKSEEFKAI